VISLINYISYTVSYIKGCVITVYLQRETLMTFSFTVVTVTTVENK